METQGLSQTTRLIRRNGVYHYRRRVPDEFVAAFGKKEVHRSLGTANLAEAKRRRAVEDLKWDVIVALSTLVQRLNERFGTDFTEADQLFFDQVRVTAERDEKVVEAAQANNFVNFSAFFARILEDLFIDRMEGNEEIFNRVMSDMKFRTAAQEHIAREVYERIRSGEGSTK